MGREAGEGFRMGNTCKSMAGSCQCIAKKPLQYCKVISLQLIKIIEGWRKKDECDHPCVMVSVCGVQSPPARQLKRKTLETRGCILVLLGTSS